MTDYFVAAEDLKKDDLVWVDDERRGHRAMPEDLDPDVDSVPAGTDFDFSVLEARPVRHDADLIARETKRCQKIVMEFCSEGPREDMFSHSEGHEIIAAALGDRSDLSQVPPLTDVLQAVEGATVYIYRDGSVVVEDGDGGTILEGSWPEGASAEHMSWNITVPEA